MPKDLRQFINRLKEQYPSDLVEVSRPVRPVEFEVTGLLQQLENEQRFPLVHFKAPENVLGEKSKFSLISNMFATRERCATALDFPREHARMPLSLEYARREKEQIKAITIPASEAPVKANVEIGDAADVRRLPIVKHFHMDLAPVITMAVILKDPDEGFYDISFVKTFYTGTPRRLPVTIHSPHLSRILAKYEARGQCAPIVNVLGHHPAFFLGGLSLAPFGTNDYDAIGSFLGEPVRLVSSETWGSDFLVPADAELVIEGELAPGERAIADPFGEVTRHYQPQCLRPVMDVTAITYRDNAIMQDIFSGHPGHWNLGGIPKEGSLYNNLNRKFGGVKSVHLPHSGCARFTTYVSMDKKTEGIAKLVGMEVLTSAPLIQLVVVVDEEIDAFDEGDVQWAVVTQTNPDRDVTVIRNAQAHFTTAMGHTKIIVDATRPLDIAFPSKIKVPEEAVERMKPADWIDAK